MQSDGSHLTYLTTGIVAKGPRSWSPDGTRVVFESDRDGDREIYSIRADGTHLPRLTHDPTEDSNPRRSPDGTQIAFTSSREGNPEVYVMPASGRDGHDAVYVLPLGAASPMRLTTQASLDPRWSP